jgi:hypothetical protein
MAFGDKLGPLFLQLSDNYTPKSLPELTAYLESCLPMYPYLLNWHKDWFAVPRKPRAVFSLFKRLNIGIDTN